MSKIDEIMEKKMFIVKNPPNRRKETDQYNVRVLRLDEVLIIMQLAKKQVFDDIEKRLIYCLTSQHEDTLFPLGGQEFRNEVLEVIKVKVLDYIKQRHLSTSQSEGTELSFKVPSQSSDKGFKPSSLN